MADECEHGSLRRSCPRREDAEHIATLTRERDAAEAALAALRKLDEPSGHVCGICSEPTTNREHADGCTGRWLDRTGAEREGVAHDRCVDAEQHERLRAACVLSKKERFTAIAWSGSGTSDTHILARALDRIAKAAGGSDAE